METPAVHFLLSYEELRLILSLLKSGPLPGMEMDPFEGLENEKKALLLLAAERALRARDLALMNNDGQLMLNRELLDLGMTCAAPERMLLVQHTPAGLPVQVFNLFGTAKMTAAHVIPQAGLHLLAKLADWETGRQEALNIAACQNLNGAKGDAFTLDAGAIRAGRELVEAGNAAGAAQHWQEKGAPPASAQSLAGLLAGPHDVTFFYTGKKDAQGKTATGSLSVIHTAEQGLAMTPLGEGRFVIEPINTAELESRLG